MLSGADEGPVYYREIQKNAFLKRIPDDAPTGKLRPLGHKKPPLKPMWTLFCVHNGRTPFLEQYPEPDCPAALAHRPAWRACLRSARHVTASVKPHAGDEYDFLVDTDHGPVRMLAPDWDSMQDWVSILRAKLHELRILSRGENVYGAPPVAPAPRAAARDPTSPLPPTPPVPPDRVPGIDLTSIARPAIETTQSTEISPTTATATATIATASATTSTNAHETTSTPTAANSTSTKTTSSSTTNLNVTTTTNLPTLTDTTTSSSFTNSITNLNIAATCVSLTPINTSNVTTFTNATANVTTFTNATANVTTFTNAAANVTTFTNATASVTTFTNATANVTTFTNATANVTTFTNATANVTTFTNATANVTTFTNATANVTTFTNATASLTNEQDNEVDISNWEPFSLPSTSRDNEPKQSVAKICGQNICLDDSILKRNVTESDEDFFAEIDKMHDATENVEDFEFTQRLVVTNGNDCTENQHDTPLRTNVTVIQVSNKAPPHTAIPVLGPETDVFDFEFKQKLKIDTDTPINDFINIVHTENDRYGSVFEKTTEEDYGHISLTTTVSLTGDVKVTDERKDGVYERLCMASTSIMPSSPLQVRSLKSMEKIRKSSLPNLEVESDYEYLFPNSSQNLPNGRNTNRDASSNANGVTDVLNREILPNSRIAHSNLQNSRDVTSRNIQTNSSSNRENVPNVRNMPSGRENLPDRTQINVTNREVVPNGRNEGNSTCNEVSRVNLSNISVRSNIERSASQNAYDVGPRQRQNEVRRVQNNCPKRDNKIEKSDSPPKPIWKRGLTELSLLSRLRGLAQPRRPESPTRQHDDRDRGVTSPVRVVHRSRAAGRADGTRRRSSSLTNSHSPGAPASPALQPLRARQAAALRAEQRRGACAATAVPVRDPPLLCDYDRQVWVARWGMGGSRSGGRAGDRVSGAAGAQPSSAAHARLLLKAAHTPVVDILFHRVPLAKIYVIHKKDQESLGIKLDSECTIVSVDGQSPAGRAGLPPPGKWAVTEVNNRPVNLVKGGEEEMNRIAANGTEVSVLIQPAALVKKIRAAIKASKPLLAIR